MTVPQKSIKRTLQWSLGIIIVFFLIQAALAWRISRNIEKEVVATAQANTLAFSHLSEMAIVAQQIRRYEKEYFIYVDNPEKRSEYQKEWAQAHQKMLDDISTMLADSTRHLSTEDKSAIEKWRSAANFYGDEMQKIFQAVNSNAVMRPTRADGTLALYTPAEINQMIKPGKDRFSAELVKGVDAMTKAKLQQTLALESVAHQGFSTLLGGILATVLLGILMGIGLIVRLPQLIAKPIAQLTQIVDQLSRGKTEESVTQQMQLADFNGLTKAIERMRVAQNIMLERLHKATTAARTPEPGTPGEAAP